MLERSRSVKMSPLISKVTKETEQKKKNIYSWDRVEKEGRAEENIREVENMKDAEEKGMVKR